jgi:glutathione S-transferase
MYTLIGSLTSPYVRKLRLFFQQINLAHDLKSINYLEENDANFLKKINPISKIPVLLINDEPLYDSRVIYYHIAKKHNIKELSLKEENYLSAIDGAMDSSINLFSLRRGGMDISPGKNSYIDRQHTRVEEVLDYLTPYAKSLDPKNPNDWNFVSISLYTYLFWANFRAMLDLSNRPDLTNFLEHFKTMPGIEETTPKA